jgi:hypothetical protein
MSQVPTFTAQPNLSKAAPEFKFNANDVKDFKPAEFQPTSVVPEFKPTVDSQVWTPAVKKTEGFQVPNQVTNDYNPFVATKLNSDS